MRIKKIRYSITGQKTYFPGGYLRKTTTDYIQMLIIYYDSVCDLKIQILLAADLGFIENAELETVNRSIKKWKECEKR